jgi:hypothetical protein
MSTPYTVNLSDPRVRAMLDSGPVVHLAGDAPDPTGTGQIGMMSTTHLTAGKQEVVVAFGDLFMTLDVYAIPGEPARVHLICPRCHKASSISGDRKRIAFEPRAASPIAHRLAQTRAPELAGATLGQISIEPFECAWEIGGDAHAGGAQRSVHTGASMCRLRLAIDDNVAKEA